MTLGELLRRLKEIEAEHGPFLTVRVLVDGEANPIETVIIDRDSQVRIDPV